MQPKIETAPGRNRIPFVSVPIYPILLAVYPALIMLANNVGELRPSAGFRSLLISLAVCATLLILLRVLLRDIHRVALTTTIWLFLFFSYGHFQILFPGQNWTRLEILLSVWIGIGISSLLWIWRTQPSLRGIALPINAIMLLLVGMSVWQFASFETRLIRLLDTPVPQATVPILKVDPSSHLPDIYYIVLDSYARADTLKNVFGFDNSQFITGLEEMGFYIARCSQSNYDRTELAFASILNLDYLQVIAPSLSKESADKSPLWKLIRNSRLRAALENLGYKVVAFATGYPWSELADADRFIQPDLKWNNLTEFEVLLLRTTMLRAAQETGLVNYNAQEYDRQVERSRLILNTLTSIPDDDRPRFVFVHLLEPHPPFVFGIGGNTTDAGQFINEKGKYTPESYARGYIGEVQFINDQILHIVRTLREQSDVPPIIIIQGDHGPWFQPPETVLTILNAYYLPDHHNLLYPSISPVNTFRLVLNEYFGADLPLLDDRNYNSPDVQPYNYEVVSNTCK